MKDPPILADILYSQTFKKPYDPELRQTLMSARRCVLNDDMAAFLYTLMLEIYGGNEVASKRHWWKRYHRRLDDCRHFSRLPHRVTWVEYSLHAMLQREVSTMASHGGYKGDAKGDLAHTKAFNSRIGWLFRQYGDLEYAVEAEYFTGGITPDGQAIARPTEASILWCTDDEPLPWPEVIEEPFGEFGSAFATGATGYFRPNVAMRPYSGRLQTVKDTAENSRGRARMMWVFLSTFNKVPIIGEHRIIPTRGFVARGAYHRFLEHKILTINIPEKAGIRKVARQALALIRRRAHQVRGHWRDDWRLPKGNKVLWIAEHQRGDASLGFVTHDYSVQHEKQ